MGFASLGFNQPQTENIRKKEISRKFQSAKLECVHRGNYLHSIRIVLSIKSNLEVKYTRGCV